ncbi:MAG TPA: divalent-cation tolerance protein CutA [Campylobacterales bacterium]|nr:divalent-cation tolerance protein CutA [Campylobacterales bacterium]
MNFDYCTITTTTDDNDIANLIAEILIGERLVACVQSHTVQSQYRWQGKVTNEAEIVLQMKTKTAFCARIEERIRSLHNYDVPEIIVTPILHANAEYAAWMEEELRDSSLHSSHTCALREESPSRR